MRPLKTETLPRYDTHRLSDGVARLASTQRAQSAGDDDDQARFEQALRTFISARNRVMDPAAADEDAPTRFAWDDF